MSAIMPKKKCEPGDLMVPIEKHVPFFPPQTRSGFNKKYPWALLAENKRLRQEIERLRAQYKEAREEITALQILNDEIRKHRDHYMGRAVAKTSRGIRLRGVVR